MRAHPFHFPVPCMRSLTSLCQTTDPSSHSSLALPASWLACRRACASAGALARGSLIVVILTGLVVDSEDAGDVGENDETLDPGVAQRGARTTDSERPEQFRVCAAEPTTDSGQAKGRHSGEERSCSLRCDKLSMMVVVVMMAMMMVVNTF